MDDVTTVGTLLINDALPEDMRKKQRTLDKKAIHQLMSELAERYPDRYKEVLNKLDQVGKTTAWSEGVSVSLASIARSQAKDAILQPAQEQIRAILDDDSIDSAERKRRIVDVMLEASKVLPDAVLKESEEQGDPLVLQVKSGARGSKNDLNNVKGAPLLTTDVNDEFLPVAITRSYAEGLTPAQYFATAYGQRKGMLAVKLATADAGFYGKQLANAAHRQVVTREKPDPTRLPVGLPVDVDDDDNVGAVLAHDAGPFKAGQLLTKDMLDDLKDADVKEVLIHSPLTEASEDGGVSAWAAGRRQRAGFHQIGDNIGIPAAQAISERLSQGALNCLAAGTMVRMADGSVKPIELIKVGDVVLGSDTSAKLRPVTVTRTYDHGLLPCHKYTLRLAASRKRRVELVCTSEHKVLGHTYYSSSSGEVHATKILRIGKLNKASGICMPDGLAVDAGVYEWRAMLLGALLGDGCYTEAVNSVRLSCADASQIEELNAYLAPHDMQFELLRGHKIYYTITGNWPRNGHAVYDPVSGRITGVRSGNLVKIWLEELGLFGKYAHEKTLPLDVVSSWDNASVAELISGLVVTDGSVFDRKEDGFGVSIASTSRELLEQVSWLLQVRFGIHPTISGSASGRKRPLHNLVITKKRDLIRFSEYIKLFGVKRARFAERLEQAKALWAAQSSDLLRAEWARLLSADDAGVQHVYDIEVDHPDHLFVLANGLIVSNSKHSAGIKDRVTRAGFEYINRLTQAPENFPEAGPLAEEDGMVDEVKPAPQGGTVVVINKREYYLPPGINPTVKPGDRLEAGDDISDGVAHPNDLVRLRGIGEARAAMLKNYREALEASGVSVNRRNIESVVAGLINWAKVTNPDGIGDAIYDDVVPYNRLAAQYKPRPNAVETDIDRAVGQYLEEPVLHYSPGTRITKKVADRLRQWGIKRAFTHAEAPDFEPHMVRGVHSIYHDPDWRTRLSGFYAAGAFEKSVQRGLESDTNSTSYVPGISEPTRFGSQLQTFGKYGTAVANVLGKAFQHHNLA